MNIRSEPESATVPQAVSRRSKRRYLIWFAGLILILGAAAWGWQRWHATSPDKTNAAATGSARRGAGNRPPARAIPVQVANVRQGDIRVYLSSLGTVTPTSSVIVRTRVDGLLLRLNFKEGQMVRAGQVLAEIDRQPLLVQLAQAEGQMAKDQALLQNARNDLARYQGLLAQDSISRQQVDTTAALVRQYEGTIKSDQAQVDSVKLQLGYTRVTAPVDGRLGLRAVDAGNMIHTSDTSGIVTINQVQPIRLLFTLPESQLPQVLEPLRSGKKLRVEAWDRDQKQMLASGRVESIDNQIDLSTGTVKLKAVFANDDGSLFPNQFVNVRLLAEIRPDAIIAPSAALQRGRAGTFVYVVKPDNSVTQRPVKTGAVDGLGIEITSGLKAGEVVVIDGIDQLREGAKIEVANAAALLKEKPRGAGKGKRHRDAEASGPAGSDAKKGDSPRDKPPREQPADAAAPTRTAQSGPAAAGRPGRDGPRPDAPGTERPHRRPGADSSGTAPANP